MDFAGDPAGFLRFFGGVAGICRKNMTVEGWNLVVACARNGVIGRGGELPWHLPSDLKFFRHLTSARDPGQARLKNVVIMGRKTWQSIPDKFRPLSNRINIIMTQDTQFNIEQTSGDVYLCRSVEQVDQTLGEISAQINQVYVIGGAAIYNLCLPRCCRVFLTSIDNEIKDGDTFFSMGPEFSRLGADETRRTFDQVLGADLTRKLVRPGEQKSENGFNFDFWICERHRPIASE